jgi:amino acid permease
MPAADQKYHQVPLIDEHAFHSNDFSQKHKDFMFEGHPAVPPTADIFSSFINLTNTIIGSGVLGIPFAFANTGWVLGGVLMLIASSASIFSLHLLAACALAVDGTPTLYSVTELTMPKFSGLVDLAVVISCFGACTSYLIVIGDLMPDVLSSMGASGTILNRELWIAIGFGIVAPLSCLKSLDALKYTSVASVLFVVFLTGIIIAFSAHIAGLDPCADIDADDTCVGDKSNVVMSMNTGRVFSIFIFAFTCQQNIFGIAAEIRDPSLSRLNIVILMSIAVTLVIYLVVACCGYSTFGGNVDPNILVSYPGAVINVCSCLVVC